MNLTIRPSWKKLLLFKEHGVPADAFYDINKWLEKKEEEATKEGDTSSSEKAS